MGLQNQSSPSEKNAINKDRASAKIAKETAKWDPAVIKANFMSEKRQKARRWMPDVFPSWTESQENSPLMQANGFVRESDQSVFGNVSAALQGDTFAKVFDSIASAVGCDRLQICLLEQTVVRREGKKVPLINFRYIFNQSFNDLLKSTEQALFNPRSKSWNIPMEAEKLNVVSQHIHDFFHVVIDVSRMVILRNTNTNDSILAITTKKAFEKLPFHVAVHRTQVNAAIIKSRPDDAIRGDRLYIHDGVEFVFYPENEIIWTQSPFLLFRYSVEEGQPRYLTFSTLGMTIERAAFGNQDKRTSLAIARYIDTCRILKLPAFEMESSSMVTQTPELRKQLQGDFDRFETSFTKIQSCISDIQIAPLCSDYATLLIQDHGADSADVDS